MHPEAPLWHALPLPASPLHPISLSPLATPAFFLCSLKGLLTFSVYCMTLPLGLNQKCITPEASTACLRWRRLPLPSPVSPAQGVGRWGGGRQPASHLAEPVPPLSLWELRMPGPHCSAPRTPPGAETQNTAAAKLLTFQVLPPPLR